MIKIILNWSSQFVLLFNFSLWLLISINDKICLQSFLYLIQRIFFFLEVFLFPPFLNVFLRLADTFFNLLIEIYPKAFILYSVFPQRKFHSLRMQGPLSGRRLILICSLLFLKLPSYFSYRMLLPSDSNQYCNF